MTVEAIKDKKKVQALLTYLKGGIERDQLLCKFKLNTGLRISNVVSFQVYNLITEQNNFKDYFIYPPQKNLRLTK